ncbi:MAG: M15 family metallopeptidase [Chitinophagales bacterium]|nr:M15 family metallopeptidase [Chitinophagales bacterium]
MIGCQDGPPHEQDKFRKNDLVELITLDSTIRLNIHYATKDNFTGTQVYKEARAFMQRPAAMALAEANKDLAPMGYGLMVYDGYRPWSITKYFWDITPEENKKFVADPQKGSVHNRGCAVDLTLYQLDTGGEVDMPSGYDEMTERSYPEYEGCTPQQKQNRELLIHTMQQHGFKVYPYEWWHFDYKDTKHYAISDIPFGEID